MIVVQNNKLYYLEVHFSLNPKGLRVNGCTDEIKREHLYTKTVESLDDILKEIHKATP